MNRSPHQSWDYEPAGVGVPPSIPFVAMPGPLNRLVHTTLPITPALVALIGPKQSNPWSFWRWLRQQVPATGSVQPRTALTQLLHFRSTPGAFPGEAGLCPLFKNQDATPSDHESMTNIPLCDLNLCHARS